jgi:hypothetical protein
MLEIRRRMSPGQRRNWWARQVSRQQSADVPVTKFCEQLGVPASTFYEWKRRLARATSISSEPALTPRRPSDPNRRERASAEGTSFVPVSILSPAADTQLEIELANACVVRVRGVIDPSLLQAAIAAAAQIDPPKADQGGR